MLIDLVVPTVRKRLVSARCTAMQFGCDAGSAELDRLVSGVSLDRPSLLSVHLLRSELLYLDNQLEQAARYFDEHVDPLLSQLEPEQAAILIDNRSTISYTAFDVARVDRFYHEVDVRRTLGVELRDWSIAYQVERDARTGKHDEALSTVWHQLLSAYRSQNWRAREWAHADLGAECLALGWPDEGTWHAVQSLDKEFVAAAADPLTSHRDAHRLLKAAERLLTYSRLAQHAALTSLFLGKSADCVPDHLITSVVNWLKPRLDMVPVTWADARVFEPVWKLVGSIAPRLSCDVALELAQMASQHGELQHRSIVRKHLIEAWSRLLPLIDPRELVRFVAPVVLLVTKLKTDVDYVDTINLMCHLASRSGQCREQIRDALLPPGTAIADPILLEAASTLGWHPQQIEKLNTNVTEIAAALRKQVQVLRDGEEPTKLGGYGTISKPCAGGRTVVHIHGAQQWADAMIRYGDSLAPGAIRELAEALLDGIANDLNIICNRAALVVSLREMISRLPIETADAAIKVLSQIARGRFAESEVAQSHADATNPLNPFKMNMGNPRDLRRVALLAIAEGSKLHPLCSETLHDGLLTEFFESADEELRRFGIKASSDSSALSHAETIALVGNGLDGSDRVRTLALTTMADMAGLEFDDSAWGLAVRSVKRAADSGDNKERFAAAKAARAFLNRAPDGSSTAARLHEILALLAKDVSFSVRKMACGQFPPVPQTNGH